MCKEPIKTTSAGSEVFLLFGTTPIEVLTGTTTPSISLLTSNYLNKSPAGVTLNTSNAGVAGQVLAKSINVGMLDWITPGGAVVVFHL